MKYAIIKWDMNNFMVRDIKYEMILGHRAFDKVLEK